jgi:periplasmic divalent cation tolerance protein
MTDFQIILSTCADREQAERIAHRLLELHLAACINILPGVQSIYRWQGGVESAAEVLMLIKTRSTLAGEVQSTIAGLHTYEVPEFLVLPVSGGGQKLILPGWKRVCGSSAGFLLCFKMILSPVVPYAASVPGFCNQFLRTTVGGFLGRPAYSAAWTAKPR